MNRRVRFADFSASMSAPYMGGRRSAVVLRFSSPVLVVASSCFWSGLRNSRAMSPSNDSSTLAIVVEPRGSNRHTWIA